MDKCLVTTLDCDVNNAALGKIGEIVVHFKGDSISNFDTRIKADMQRMYIEGSEDAFLGETASSTSGVKEKRTQTDMYGSTGDYYIHIENKYELNQFRLTARNLQDFDIAQLSYASNLTSAIIEYSTTTYGDISIIADKVKLTRLTLRGSKNIIGNIADLSNLTVCTQMEFDETSIEGSLEAFASEMAKSNRDGQLKVTGNNVITFNGSPFTGTKTIVFNGAGGYSIA